MTAPSEQDRRQNFKPRGKHRQGRTGSWAKKTKNPAGPPVADTYIYGLHAAEFALRNAARAVLAIWTTENAERKLEGALRARSGNEKLTVTRVSPRDLDKRLGADTVHQGIALEVAPLATCALEDLAERAVASRQPIVVLDQVTDPHNVGAVLRSCAVFGAAGVLMTQRHSPPLGGALAKAASGALDLMPVCLVQNLAKALDELKRQSLAVIGLDGGDDLRLLDAGLGDRGGAPVVLVLGAEGRGLRELTRQSCDELCRIGGDGPIASLNVSNAAAVALHLAAMLRR